MIPKKIHYCWLSGEKIPEMPQKCMNTWKEFLPDYELVLWDKKKFDINSIDFVKEACGVKKWAFAADYIRLYAVYTEGGIYLDTDVIVKKSFDKFLENDFFSAIESYAPYDKDKNKIYVYENGSVIQRIAGTSLQAAVFGAIPKHPFLKDCLDWYKDKRFIMSDNSFADNIVAPDIYATIAQKYGFRYKNEEQNLAENMKIYPSEVIASNIWGLSKENYAVHCCAGSWKDESFPNKLIAKNNFIRKLTGRPPKIKDMYSFVQNSPIWGQNRQVV
jgi:mannosyltransferase OCH1-like enzyme